MPGRIRLPLRRPLVHLRGWHRPSDTVALRQLTTQLQQQSAVFTGLHPFGNDTTPEDGGQSDDALQNGHIIGVIKHVSHKALIDLEHGNPQALEVGQ